MAIEIVDLPINSMVIFHSYVNVYQRVTDSDTKKRWILRDWENVLNDFTIFADNFWCEST